MNCQLFKQFLAVQQGYTYSKQKHTKIYLNKQHKNISEMSVNKNKD